MGAIHCEIHGTTGSIFACTHIANYVYGKTLAERSPIKAVFNTMTLTALPLTNSLKIAGIHCYCNLCSVKFRFYGKGFGNVFQLLFNGPNIYRFVKQSYFVCIECFFLEFFEIEAVVQDTISQYMNTTTKIRNTNEPLSSQILFRQSLDD